MLLVVATGTICASRRLHKETNAAVRTSETVFESLIRLLANSPPHTLCDYARTIQRECQSSSLGRALGGVHFVRLLALGCVVCSLLGGGDGPVGVAYLEAGEAAHGDVLAELADLLRDELRDGHGLLLDEGLIEQADLFVELAHLAFDDLLDHRRRLAGCGGLGAIDILLALHVLGSDVLLADVAGVGGCDVHRDVLEQLLEVLGAGDEVALAIELDQHADLAAG